MEKFRIAMLAVLLLGTSGVLIRAVVKAVTIPIQTFTLPEEVPVTAAIAINSQSLDRAAPNSYITAFDSRRYEYSFQDQPLEAEVLYVEGTGGSLERFFENFEVFEQASMPNDGEIRQRPGLGFYQVYRDPSYAYLSACIAPAGRSTVTFDQFIQDWNSHPYLLGRDYVDDRCIWVHLRRSLGAHAAEVVYQELEAVWYDWHSYWRRNYPKLETLNPT